MVGLRQSINCHIEFEKIQPRYAADAKIKAQIKT